MKTDEVYEALEEQLSLCNLTLDNKDEVIDNLNKYIDKIFNVLIDQGYLKGKEIIKPIKPGHGSCCCCQVCGRDYDDCVCLHNDLLRDIYE